MHGLPPGGVEIRPFSVGNVAEMILPSIRGDGIECPEAIDHLIRWWREGIGLDLSGLGKHTVCLEKYGEENDTDRQATKRK
jgi:hypothetical protein